MQDELSAVPSATWKQIINSPCEGVPPPPHFPDQEGNNNLTTKDNMTPRKSLHKQILLTSPYLLLVPCICAFLQFAAPRAPRFLSIILSLLFKFTLLCPNSIKACKPSCFLRGFLFSLWSPQGQVKLVTSNKSLCFFKQAGLFFRQTCLLSVYFTEPAREPKRVEKNFPHTLEIPILETHLRPTYLPEREILWVGLINLNFAQALHVILVPDKAWKPLPHRTDRNALEIC